MGIKARACVLLARCVRYLLNALLAHSLSLVSTAGGRLITNKPLGRIVLCSSAPSKMPLEPPLETVSILPPHPHRTLQDPPLTSPLSYGLFSPSPTGILNSKKNRNPHPHRFKPVRRNFRFNLAVHRPSSELRKSPDRALYGSGRGGVGTRYHR